MSTGVIQQTIEVFQTAFHDLHVTTPLLTIERLAVIIHHAMGGTARHFHTLEHIFDIIQPSDPLCCLAALFHDIVYYQIDKGVPAEISAILAPYIQEDNNNILIASMIPPKEKSVLMALDVFGFEAGQQLAPFGGLNEFLSAIVMNKTLEGILSEQALLQITTCIEATIPFRGTNAHGESWPEILEQRLQRANEQNFLSLSSADIEAMIKRAVVFGNRDVANFAELDVGKFLDNTWKLLPETNSTLRSAELYSIQDFRKSLQKTAFFLENLNPDTIFHCYRGTPPEKEFQSMVSRARANLHIAREYLGIKLLAMGILEALAEMTGGDAPLSLFMGDIRKDGDDVKRLEDFLPADLSDHSDHSSSLAALLTSGRTGETQFDMTNSPTSFFLYQHLDPTKLKQAVNDANDMFAGKLSVQNFLNSLDRPVLSAIARASAAMVVTRRAELLRYAKDLKT